MVISLLRDIWRISGAPGWEMGGVEVTHGHELPAAPGPAATPAPLDLIAGAATAGTATRPAKATATTTVTSRRARCLPLLRRTRRTSAPTISPPPMRLAPRPIPTWFE